MQQIIVGVCKPVHLLERNSQSEANKKCKTRFDTPIIIISPTLLTMHLDFFATIMISYSFSPWASCTTTRRWELCCCHILQFFLCPSCIDIHGFLLFLREASCGISISSVGLVPPLTLHSALYCSWISKTAFSGKTR